MFGVEGEGCCQHQKTLRMRISLEGRAERLAYRGATAVRADQVRSIELVRAPRVLDQHLDPVIELPQRRDPRGKIHSGLGKAAQALGRHVGELVLLALHDIRKAGVVFERAEVELGDNLAACPVPDAKLRLDQPAADDLFHQA